MDILAEVAALATTHGVMASSKKLSIPTTALVAHSTTGNTKPNTTAAT